jgi:hypothetical protein
MPVDDAGARPLTTRRAVLTAALAGAGATGLALVAGPAGAAGAGVAPAASAATAPPTTSPRRALAFLDAAADAYPASNPGVRLAQSYADELGLFSTAFVYDNALAICAHLSGGRRARARQLGDALLYAMDHDPGYADGRLRQAYNVGPYVFYDGSPQPHGFVLPDGGANVGSQFGFLGTAVGDMAWPGIALAQLHSATGDRRYLAGALRIATWIVDNAYSTTPLGGYQFGVDGGNAKVSAWSTEHNIDVLGFFGLLHQATRDRAWRELAAHAGAFVDRMYDPTGGWFWTGSDDGTTINTDPVPLDPQTWGWLVLRDRRASGALDWADRDLRTTDVGGAAATSQLPQGFSVDGVTFSTASLTSTAQYNGITVHPDGVWLEGTGQLVCAWQDRGRRRDRQRVEAQLRQVRAVQSTLGQGQVMGGNPLPAASGVVAASSLLDTGFGFGYFQVQHVGATSWYVMGALATNPYQSRGLR